MKATLDSGFTPFFLAVREGRLDTVREFLAAGDTALVTVTIFNHGDSAVTLNDVTVSGAIPVRMTEAVRVPPHGSAHIERSVVNLAYAHPWWIWKPQNNFYPRVMTSLDGAPRAGPPLPDWNALAVQSGSGAPARGAPSSDVMTRG